MVTRRETPLGPWRDGRKPQGLLPAGSATAVNHLSTTEEAEGGTTFSSGLKATEAEDRKSRGRRSTPFQSHPRLVVVHFTYEDLTEILRETGNLPLPRGRALGQLG